MGKLRNNQVKLKTKLMLPSPETGRVVGLSVVGTPLQAVFLG